MRLRIDHVTQYEYSVALKYAHQSLCLTPQESAHQRVVEWTLSAPGPLFAQRDGWGNAAHTWTLARRLYAGSIRAQGVVETHGSPWIEADGTWPLMFLRPTPLTAANDELRAMGRRHLGDTVDERAVLRLAAAIADRLPYCRDLTAVDTPAAEALALGGGVCQDHAHAFLAACRSHGVPARYVSGYFHAPQAPHLASHAWVDAWIGDASHGRWFSVDVTHGCPMDERHVRLAVGPDYAACPPIRGVREGGGEERMHVSVAVREEPAEREQPQEREQPPGAVPSRAAATLPSVFPLEP